MDLKNFTPSTRLGRTVMGAALICGGILGFLPVLGFWMIPMGLIILSQDFPVVRRWRRNWAVKIGRWWAKFRNKGVR